MYAAPSERRDGGGEVVDSRLYTRVTGNMPKPNNRSKIQTFEVSKGVTDRLEV
jgi:hypothetical protein